MSENTSTAKAVDIEDVQKKLSEALDKIFEQEKIIEELKKEITVLNQKSWLSEQCGDDLWDK